MKPFTVPAAEPNKPPVIYACAHWRSFPPPFVTAGLTVEEARVKGLVTENEYQRTLVWQRTCGLTDMVQDKCLTCPHVRIAGYDKRGLPVLTTLDGSLSVPAVDLPTLELNGRRFNPPKIPTKTSKFMPVPGIVGQQPGGVKGGNGRG